MPLSYKVPACVTIALCIHKRPGHPGSPDVLSANRFLHFRRYSEACFGRMERLFCQVYAYFRFYYSGLYYYVLAFSNYVSTNYIARATTKRHLAGDCLYLSSPPNWGGVIIVSVFIDFCYRSIRLNRRSIRQSIVESGRCFNNRRSLLLTCD